MWFDKILQAIKKKKNYENTYSACSAVVINIDELFSPSS